MKRNFGILLSVVFTLFFTSCKKDLIVEETLSPQFELEDYYVPKHCEINGKDGAECVVGTERICKTIIPCRTDQGINDVLLLNYSEAELEALAGQEITNQNVLEHLRNLDIIY